MDYKKKYKEANDKVATRFGTNVAKEIFSDLYESEDERIRKALISFLKSPFVSENITDEKVAPWIVWLEKQGTSYTKRDVDDAYVEGMAFAKHELEKQGGIDNCTLECSTNTVITDSKKNQVKPKFKVGDVLCDKSCTTLNKESQPNFEITDIRNGMYICDKCSFPISQQDEYELVAKRIEQKPWSEEDEKMINSIIEDFGDGKTSNMLQEYWLKSLKQRIGG